MTTRWIICGTASGVGKTHLAQRLCQVLPKSVYAKCGHGKAKADKPPNFFHTQEDLAAFICRCGQDYEHLVIESNTLARRGQGDIIVFLDAAAWAANPREDAGQLREGSHVRLGPGAQRDNWEEAIRPSLPDPALRCAVCDLFLDQKRFICPPPLRVGSKTWLLAGDSRAFGAGLACLMQHVDTHGTLRQAAQSAGISYHHAWDMITSAERHLGRKLILRYPGGPGGGRSQLSLEGRRLLNVFSRLREEVAEFADRRFTELYQDHTPDRGRHEDDLS